MPSMSRYGRVVLLLEQILEVCDEIARRIEPYSEAEQLLPEQGRAIRDSIAYALIGLGENLKRADDLTEGQLVRKFPQAEFRAAIRMRDRLAHGYFFVESDLIYAVAKHELPALVPYVHDAIRQFRDEP